MSFRLQRTVVLVLAVLLPWSCGSASRRKGEPPRSALLLTISGLRADRMNAYLYERPTTYLPATIEEREGGRDLSLDDVASQGVIFADAFAPSGSSAASLAALHTGRHPLETCVLDASGSLPPEAELLAERFQAAGFHTAARTTGLALEGNAGLARGYDSLGTDFASDEEALGAARDWIEGIGEEPFFLWIHLRGPSVALETTSSEARSAAYDAALARTSARTRHFLRWLSGTENEGLNRLRSTALVVTAPTGMEFGEHGFEGHRRSLYDAGLRVPLILRHPASMTGRRVLAGVVSLERIAPTLADWFELPAAGGESLLPRIDGSASPDPDAALVATRGGRSFALRTNEWRFVFDRANASAQGSESGAEPPSAGLAQVPRVQLFDVVRDPREQLDRASEPQLHRVRAELAARLASLLVDRSGCIAPDTLALLEELASL